MTQTDQTEKPSFMEGFSDASRSWFSGAFAAPTGAQVEAWEAIRSGENALIIAPTGSGKTLAAFLWAVDRLAHYKSALSESVPLESASQVPTLFEVGSPSAQRGTNTPVEEERKGVKVLYISPLKALGVDVERNLRAPLAGIREATVRGGGEAPNLTVGVRSGDTPPAERRRLLTHPPDILITTPESLYLLLTSQGADTLATVETVIVDEVHALAGNKRGAHLALSLERLDSLLDTPAQRIGLSATVEPASEVARFLGGDRPVRLVRPRSTKIFDITVEVPVEDMTNPPMPEQEFIDANSNPADHRVGSMWPPIERSLYERIVNARSTIVFTNSRRLAERLTTRLNSLHVEATGEEGSLLARAHHGSVSKDQRYDVEEGLKNGTLRCVVATASLELGIDMGEVDLVVQIDPPPSVASGLQRLGRSGHQVGGESIAVFYPTHRSKLLETAVIARRMVGGQIEALRILSNPLDVLAQQTVAAAAFAPLDVDRWFDTVRRSAPFANLPRSAYVGVLDLISGKYPSTEFAALRARVDWDRTVNTLTARPGAQRLAVTNGGTIPDRGLYRVVVGAEEKGSTRVGELDEEMVYETRVGEVFSLGTTPWRVRRITRDTVEVEPAFGQVAKAPFWHGDSMSRPAELGAALGDLITLVGNATDEEAAALLREAGFDENALANTLAYIREQQEQVGHLPTRQTLVVEKTRDDIGDWQLILQSPLGLAVHSPWALAINARLRDRWGLETKAVASNDGIIVRLPDMDVADEGSAEEGLPTAADIFLFDPQEITDIVQVEVANAAVFASRFREAAARSLILGASKPGKRSPLWQQRLRASSLLEVASRYPDFPMILEAMREVLQDVYDVRALEDVLRQIDTRQMSVVEVETEFPSPFARSLLFGYVGEFMYGGDTPVGERRIAALSVDPQVLRELLGEIPLRDLLEVDAILEVEAELQRTRTGWQAKGADGLVDLLRSLGPLTVEEISVRFTPDGGDVERKSDEDTPTRGADSEDSDAEAPSSLFPILQSLVAARRLIRVRIAGSEYIAATEDAGLLIAAAGVVTPPGVGAIFLEAPADPIRELLIRHAASSAPFTSAQVAQRFGIADATVQAGLRRLENEGAVLSGLFLPEELAITRGMDADEPQWVSRKVVERMRTRSLAHLRGSVEPASPEAYTQFLTSWQHCRGRQRGVEGAYAVIEQLAGLPLPASTWETLVLPERIVRYESSYLDSLVLNGEVTWVGSGAIGGRDGWVAFIPAGAEGITRPAAGIGRPRTEVEKAILAELGDKGALFAGAIIEGLPQRGVSATPAQVAEAMWALVWDGLITSDSVAALRARISGRKSAQKTQAARPRGRALTRRRMAGLGTSGRGGAPVFDPTLAGRWSLIRSGEEISGSREAEGISAAAATLWAVEMVERYGILTRGCVVSEGFPGGFAQAYQFFSDFEISGACRRGYYVRGLGGAQFAVPGAVDQLRHIEDRRGRDGGDDPDKRALTLSVTDPANPYGAALSWPEVAEGKGTPKRNPGALVTLVAGRPALYIERGGKTAVDFGSLSDAARVEAATSLVRTCRRGDMATFTIEKINGRSIRESEWWDALREAGFAEVPRGLTLRRKIT